MKSFTPHNLRSTFASLCTLNGGGPFHIKELLGNAILESRPDANRSGFEAAERWCANATLLTETQRRYLKVPQKEFEQSHPSTFKALGEGMFASST